jgi:hypothetical protein
MISFPLLANPSRIFLPCGLVTFNLPLKRLHIMRVVRQMGLTLEARSEMSLLSARLLALEPGFLILTTLTTGLHIFPLHKTIQIEILNVVNRRQAPPTNDSSEFR